MNLVYKLYIVHRKTLVIFLFKYAINEGSKTLFLNIFSVAKLQKGLLFRILILLEEPECVIFFSKENSKNYNYIFNVFSLDKIHRM